MTTKTETERAEFEALRAAAIAYIQTTSWGHGTGMRPEDTVDPAAIYAETQSIIDAYRAALEPVVDMESLIRTLKFAATALANVYVLNANREGGEVLAELLESTEPARKMCNEAIDRLRSSTPPQASDVERVAKALARHAADNMGTHGVGDIEEMRREYVESKWPNYIPEAKAAIAAMSAPTMRRERGDG